MRLSSVKSRLSGKNSAQDTTHLWTSTTRLSWLYFASEVYLHAYNSVCDAEQSLKNFMSFNQNSSYTALDDKTPDEFYFDNLPAMQKTEWTLAQNFHLRYEEIIQSSEATSLKD